MKKVFKILVMVVLTATIVLTLPLTSFAYEYGKIDIDTMVVETKKDEKVITSISANNINRIRNSKSKKYKNLSDEKKLEEILIKLGVDFNDAQKDEIMSNVKLSDVSNISTSTAYIEVDNNGKQKIISKEEAMIAIEKNNDVATIASETGPTTHHGTEPETSSNGYMEQVIVAFYTPNYYGVGTTKGRYAFIGRCTWLIPPLVHKTDCIGFYSADFRWEDKNKNDNLDQYNLLVAYQCSINNNYNEDGGYIANEDKASVSQSKGIFFTYDMPKNVTSDAGSFYFYNFEFLITAIGYTNLSVNAANYIGIDLVYTHTQFSLTSTVSFNWVADNPFAVSTTLTSQTKNYIHSHSWKYSNDYYA